MEFVHDYTLAQWEALDPATREGTIYAPFRHLSERLGAGDDLVRRIRTSALREQYRVFVIEGILVGSPVSEAVLAGHPDFRATLDAQPARLAAAQAERRALYGQEGTNRNSKLQSRWGVVLRMADGSPVAPALLDEARKAMAGVDHALGPRGDIWRRAGLTIVYGVDRATATGPNDLAALHPDLMTIALTRGYRNLPFYLLAHELGHLLDLRHPRPEGVEGVRIYRSEFAASSRAADSDSRLDDELHRRALDTMRCRTCTGRCGFVCRTNSAKCHCWPFPDEPACTGLRAMPEYFRSPREVWARLFQQYVATRTGKRGRAAVRETCYQELPAFWDRGSFAALEPLIGDAVDRRRAHWLARP